MANYSLLTPDAMTAKGWRLLYFSAPTRGEQVRLLFHAAKTPFEDVRLDFPKGLAQYKHAAMGDSSPLLFDQCPTVTSPEGEHVSQVAAAMQFVGRRTGLAPKDEGLDARAMSLTLFSEEIRNTVFYKLLIPGIVHGVLRRKCCGIFCCFGMLVNLFFRTGKVRAGLKGKLEHLESALRAGGGSFFCGESMCYADVALFDCIRESLAMPGYNKAAELQPFPKLQAWLDRMEAVPELKEALSKRGSALETLLASIAP